ncbi:glycosyltransferase family 18 protein, partial [Calocera viscosa TUFC12733]
NGRAVRSLVGCLARNECAQNQTGVVFLASPKFGPGIESYNNAERAWALSVQNALQQLGYTYLWFPSLADASATYRLFPDLVKLVLAEGSDVAQCFDSPHCIKSPSNALGFPTWKLFSFSPEGAVTGPLGAEWVLAPDEFGTGAQVLGYSVEDACRARPFVRRAEREQHVYVLGDRLSYWYHRDYAWDDGAFWGLRDAFYLEMTLVGGLVNDTQWDTYWPPYMDNYGAMSAEDYYSLLGHSEVLVGTGLPANSPAPYEALCFGVPFINPILRWDEKRPFHRESWVTQNDALKHLEPPYVYHVKKMDREGLVKAVRAARATPIGRFIAPHMYQSALRQRVGELVETDWHAKAQQLLSRRVAAFEGPVRAPHFS